MTNIPIFPLNTVLFPEGILPLRIFEARYMDMIGESMREDKPFGVCLITKGNETGEPAEFHHIGTYAHIIDWEQGNDGLLAITVQGSSRFRVVTSHVRSNRLQEAEVETIDDNDDEELPVQFHLLSEILQQIADKYQINLTDERERYLDANWVGCRLSELLPLDLNKKQQLLEIDDPVVRLDKIQSLLHVISENGSSE